MKNPLAKFMLSRYWKRPRKVNNFTETLRQAHIEKKWWMGESRFSDRKPGLMTGNSGHPDPLMEVSYPEF
ncbi:MAG: hypothetical protein QM640_00150 [Niabella sp.]